MPVKDQIRCVLGMDAGGTHTRCQISDEYGRIVSVGCGGPANTNFVSPKSAQSAVEHALSHALKSRCHRVEAAVIAGPHLPKAALDIVSQHAETEKVTVTDEFEATLAAGLRRTGGWGVVIMSGTGSFCKGRNAVGEEKYVGGWGPLAGDEGSGYDLAKEALTALVRAYDGRGKETMLTKLMFSHLKIRKTQDLKKSLYNPPMKRHKLAELARFVFTAAEAGDKVAEEILRTGGFRLAHLAFPVLNRLFAKEESFPVVLSGGIPREGSIITDTLISEIKRVRPRSEVFVSGFQPVTGAVIIGLHSIGVQIDSKVIGNLNEGNPKTKHFGGSWENREQ